MPRISDFYSMKYGKLDGVDGLDLRLPADHPQTQRVLRHAPGKPLEVRVGGTMWNIPEWKGKIYPAKLAQKDMPLWYCKQFGTLELNATHYKIHPPETLAKWAGYADDDFRFCPKFPQLITHYRRFNNCEGLTDEFIEAVLALGVKRGPCFIQLPPNFAPKSAHVLTDYLRRWPRELALAVEFRHPEWFTGDAAAETAWQALEELGIGAVISDTAGRRDAVHMRVTAPFLLLRFGGNDLHPSDETRLNEWAARIADWHTGGLGEVHLLMHQPNSVTTPESCALFAAAMQRYLGVQIRLPRSPEQPSLF